MGHALAAAREDVQLFGLGILIAFTIPIAYVHISSEQLTSLPLKNQLRVTCAGIWHNVVLAVLAATVLMFSTWLWAPFYALSNGVYVKTILPVSEMYVPPSLLFNYALIVKSTKVMKWYILSVIKMYVYRIHLY